MTRRSEAGGGFGLRLAGGLWRAVRGESRLVSSRGAGAGRLRGGARARDEAEDDHLASDEDRRLERGVLAAEGPRLGDLVIRYRRELAPVGAALALVLVAAEGHQQAPTRWGLAFVLAGLLVIAWHFRASRPVERLYGAGVGVAVAGLLASGWALDVVHPAWWALLVAATVLAGLPWWRHVLPRGRLLLRGHRPPKSTRQQAGAVVKAWPSIAEARGIGGVKLQTVTPDAYGWTMRLRIPTASKHTVRSVVAAVDGLTASFRVRPGAVRVEPVPTRADLALVRVNVTDPLERAIDYPGLSATSIAAPLRLGIYEDRSALAIGVPGGHWLLGGSTGSGKSVLQRVVLAELLQREDVVAWGVDVAKAGVQFVPFVAGLDKLATDAGEAVAMLGAAMAAQRARAKWMASKGLTEWPLDREHPQLVLVLDELSDLLTIPGVGELLEALTKLGREQGISVVGATQRASADALGDSAVARSQFGVRVALRCAERGDSDLILGAGKSAEGWRADRLTLPGSMLVRAEGQGLTVPRPGRAYLLSTAEARRIAERAAETRARLDDVTAAAVAEAATPATVAPPVRRGGRPSARTRVLELLTGAGADGISGPDLVAALEGDVSRPTVYRVLGELQEEGLVDRDELGVWTVAGAGPATT